MDPMVLPYREYRPAVRPLLRCGPGAVVIGRTEVGDSVALGRLAVLRGDGERISIGSGCWLGARATVHIADDEHGSVVGGDVVVGRYALVHGCTLADRVVVGDAAVVMDRAVVGPGAVIATGALVPPGKKLAGGRRYAGSPARPVRTLASGEVDQLAAAVRRSEPSPATATDDDPLPPLDDTAFRPPGSSGPLHGCNGSTPVIPASAYVAPTAAVWGDVRLGRGASVWFSTAMRAGRGRIVVGDRTNVQDNSFVDVAETGASTEIGNDVTIGHNVRLEACRIGDRCLVGMGATGSAGVTVEDDALVGARAWVAPGTVVRAGWIWAGRPAKPFREVRPEEADYFRQGKEIYEGYARDYQAGGREE